MDRTAFEIVIVDMVVGWLTSAAQAKSINGASHRRSWLRCVHDVFLRHRCHENRNLRQPDCFRRCRKTKISTYGKCANDDYVHGLEQGSFEKKICCLIIVQGVNVTLSTTEGTVYFSSCQLFRGHRLLAAQKKKKILITYLCAGNLLAS